MNSLNHAHIHALPCMVSARPHTHTQPPCFTASRCYNTHRSACSTKHRKRARRGSTNDQTSDGCSPFRVSVPAPKDSSNCVSACLLELAALRLPAPAHAHMQRESTPVIASARTYSLTRSLTRPIHSRACRQYNHSHIHAYKHIPAHTFHASTGKNVTSSRFPESTVQTNVVSTHPNARAT
jgi:hypothetical protein